MDNKKIIDFLKTLLNKPMISHDDVLEAEILYPSFKGFDDVYNTMTPIDRRRVIGDALDTLESNITYLVDKHLGIISNVVTNLPEFQQSRVNAINKNLFMIKDNLDVMSIEDCHSFSKEKWYSDIPATIRKYIGRDLVKILKDIDNSLIILDKVVRKLIPAITGMEIDKQYKQYLTTLKTLAKPNNLHETIVPQTDYLLYLGTSIILHANEDGELVLKTLFFPENADQSYPLPNVNEIKNILKPTKDVLNKLLVYVDFKEEIISKYNKTIVDLKTQPEMIDIRNNDKTELMIKTLLSALHIYQNLLITLDEITEMISDSARFRSHF